MKGQQSGPKQLNDTCKCSPQGAGRNKRVDILVTQSRRARFRERFWATPGQRVSEFGASLRLDLMLTLVRGSLLRSEAGFRDRRRADGSCLATYFARMVTLRSLQRQPLQTASRRHRPLSRNCALRRRQRAATTVVKVPEDETLHDSILSLQAQIAALERSVLLRDSARLLWRTNSSAVALDLTREYFAQFSHGYASSTGARSETTDRYVASVFRSDVFCREFQGLQYFMDQWEKYTIFHRDLQLELHSMRLVDADKTRSNAVNVQAIAEISFTFTLDSFRFLYPSLYAKSLRNSTEQDLVHALVGRRACLPLELVLNFDTHGQVLAFETRVDLVSPLLQLLHCPSAALYVFQSSIMTRGGVLQATPDRDAEARREDMLPTQLL
jgi:hypothetical protein